MMVAINRPDEESEEFEQHRTHLRGVAFRMLGSAADADDAVQETWLRFDRSETSDVANLRGWLTTVVARICLDLLRSRSARREDLTDSSGEDLDRELAALTGAALTGAALPGLGSGPPDPAAQAELADSVSLALLVVLESLAPAERLAFVLHDLFAVPFEEIADIIDRSPAATRQLASRARRRVQGSVPRDALPDLPEEATVEPREQREIVDAFLAASKGGDLGRLIELLHPDAVVRSDATALRMGSPAEVHGAKEVAEYFSGRAKAARLAFIEGRAGCVWALRGVPQVAFVFGTEGGRVTSIDFVGDPERLANADITYFKSSLP